MVKSYDVEIKFNTLVAYRTASILKQYVANYKLQEDSDSSLVRQGSV